MPPAPNVNGHKFSSIKQNTATLLRRHTDLQSYFGVGKLTVVFPRLRWACVNHTTRLFTCIVCNLALKTSRQIGLCLPRVLTGLMASELRVPAIMSPHELRDSHIGFFGSLGSFF